jgi:hypothetical protein
MEEKHQLRKEIFKELIADRFNIVGYGLHNVDEVEEWAHNTQSLYDLFDVLNEMPSRGQVWARSHRVN